MSGRAPGRREPVGMAPLVTGHGGTRRTLPIGIPSPGAPERRA
jgi:hypothetical protein